jgi:hypothetical protein
MAAGLIVCELLCYLFVKYGNVPIDSIKKVILSFYSGSEISTAKELLYKVAFDLNDDKVEGLPRNVSRRKSENRSAIEVDDIVNLFDALDERQLLPVLPEFVARKPDRLPPMRTDELDLCIAVQRISALEEKLSFVMSQCVQLSSMVTEMKTFISTNACQQRITALEESVSLVKSHCAVLDTGVSVDKCTETTTSSSTHSGVKYDGEKPSVNEGEVHIVRSDVSWAGLADDLKCDDFTEVKRKRIASPLKQRSSNVLKGTSGQTPVQGVPRRITAFVGRLHVDTTETDLQDMLASVGIVEPVCKKLKAPEGKTFNTAAFCVSASEISCATFYRADTWPAGAELRDWVFYTKK